MAYFDQDSGQWVEGPDPNSAAGMAAAREQAMQAVRSNPSAYTNPYELYRTVGPVRGGDGNISSEALYQYLISQGLDPAYAQQVRDTAQFQMDNVQDESHFGTLKSGIGSMAKETAPLWLAAIGAMGASGTGLFAPAAGGSASAGGTALGSASAGGTSGASLGGGLSMGAGGVTGITPGVGSTAIGGGALGTGIGASTGSLGAFGGLGGAGLTGIVSGAGQAAGRVLGDGNASGGSTGGAGGTVNVPGIGNVPISLLGGVLGAGASLFGGSEQGTTTSVQDIPEWLKPYAASGLGGLMDAYNSTPSGVAPITQQGGDYLSDVIGGDYLNSNPYLDDMFDQAAGKVSGKIAGDFGRYNRFGSGAHQGILGESLGNLATNIYGTNFTNERTRQQQAAMSSGEFGTGILNQPFNRAKNLLSGVSSIRGGTTTTPYFTNPMGDLLSGGLGGALIGKTIFG